MTGRTHIAVGAAAALVAAGPRAGLVALVAAAAGGAVGAALPDLDVRNTAHPLRDRAARLLAAALLAGALALDAASGAALLRAASSRGLAPLALGAVALAGLACASRLSAHRGFSHSLPALLGYAAATWLVCAPLAPSVAVGFATHLALDALNFRGLRLLWPSRWTFCLRLAKTGGIVDACLLVAALVVAAGVATVALGLPLP